MEKLIRLAVIAWSELRWTERFGQRMTAGTACAVLAFLSVIAATGMGVTGLWIYLAASVGGAAASWWSALAFAVIAGMLIGAAHLIFQSSSGPRQAHRSIPSAHEDLLACLQKGVGENKTAALISALLLGLTVGSGQRPR